MRSIKQLRILLPLSLAILLVFDSCKKDPFNEQDAIAAQKELLQMKFNYDLAIANVGLQIQRAGDSARIAIQNSINTTALSLKLAEYNYLLGELKYRDSLSRIQDYVSRVGGLKNYTVRVVDAVSKAPISGATVKVLPWGTSSFTTVKTNSDGLATFTNIILDPSAIFYANDENTGITSATTMIRRDAIEANYTMPVYRYTGTSGTSASSSSGVLITGQLRANLDATNLSIENLGAGHTVTASTKLTAAMLNSFGIESPDVTWSFATLTSATGSYSVRVPVGLTYTVSASLITSTWKQKMFVNYIDGTDNPLTSVTRVDSTDVLLSSSTANTYQSLPAVNGYYIKLPADSVFGSELIIRDNSSQAFLNALLNAITTEKTAGGKFIDTIKGTKAQDFSVLCSNMVLANGWWPDASYYNYKLRVDTFKNKLTEDTLTAELVMLHQNGMITSLPSLKLITTTGGKVSKIILARDGANIANPGTYKVTEWVDANLTYSGVQSTWVASDVNLYFRNYNPVGAPNASLTVVVPSTQTTSLTSRNINYGVVGNTGFNTQYPKIK